jgi:hypothetical protein
VASPEQAWQRVPAKCRYSKVDNSPAFDKNDLQDSWNDEANYQPLVMNDGGR